jgi:putative tricarboxylic transport membrane protein
MRLLLLGLVMLGLGYLWGAWQIPLDPWAAEETINSRTLPILYGVSLCALVGLVAVGAHAERLATVMPPGLRRLGGLLGAMVLFAVLVPRIGVWLAIPALLTPAMWTMGERRYWALTLLPLVTAAFAWLVVARGLGLYVPRGSWLV